MSKRKDESRLSSKGLFNFLKDESDGKDKIDPKSPIININKKEPLNIKAQESNPKIKNNKQSDPYVDNEKVNTIITELSSKSQSEIKNFSSNSGKKDISEIPSVSLKSSKNIKQDNQDQELQDSTFKHEIKQSKINLKKPDSIAKLNYPYLLLSSSYNRQTNKAKLTFYDVQENRLLLLDDPTNHEPYFIVKMQKSSTEQLLPQATKYNIYKGLIKRIEEIKIEDRLHLTKNKVATKIFVETPGDVPKIRGLFEELDIPTFESDIRYHLNFLFDRELIPGMFYTIDIKHQRIELFTQINKQTQIPVNEDEKRILENFKNNPKYSNLIDNFLPLFVENVPELVIYGLDIEIAAPEGIFPRASQASFPVSTVGIVNNHEEGWLLYLNTSNQEFSILRHENLPESINLELFPDETTLLKRLYEIIPTLPIIVTYNGDDFDIPYLVNRNKKLRIKNSPVFYNNRMKTGSFQNGIHIDLYRWFSNPAIKLYAYSGMFKDAKLNTVAEALLGEEKGKYSYEGEIWELKGKELIYYCFKDTDITVKLLTDNNYLSFKLMSLISRITHVPLDELASRRVSSWLQYFFQFEHRRRNYLIPKASEIKKSKGMIAASQATIKDKKFQGAIVIDPVKGIHFDVTVLDFASLYPSIISSRNLSYETILCHHEQCKTNTIPGTSYYSCTLETGIISLLVGFLKDIRVDWFKKLANTNHPLAEFYKIVEKSLKVLINASYGVLGAEFFAFYCLPVAESTTAVGRHAINKTIDKCKELGVTVLYGDTDSVFVYTPSKAIINTLIDWSEKELKIILEVDKEYRFIALSERKKNYVGILKNGAIDIKGVLGKKSNTPKFIQNAFQETIELLQQVHSPEAFEETKEEIKIIIKKSFDQLKKSRKLGISKLSYKPNELSFTVQLTKFTHQYEQNVQHVKAAKQYEEFVRNKGNFEFRLQPGQFINYIKCKDNPIALELVENGMIIDVQTYKSHLESTFSQLLDAIGLDIKLLSTQTVNLSKFLA